jgi:hypothetical protein
MASSTGTLQIAIAPVGFSPSLARTVLWAQCGQLGFSGLAFPSSVSLPDKAPSDDEDYSVDLTGWLADADDVPVGFGPGVISISPTGAATDLGIVWASFFGLNPTLLLSGGAGGQTYVIEVPIVTALGRRRSFQMRIYVNGDTPDAAPTPAALYPPNALSTDDSLVLLTDDGLTLILS